MKIHRAITLGAMIVFSVLFLIYTFPTPVAYSGRNVIALVIVVVGAAVAGIAFSWTRYFPRRMSRPDGAALRPAVPEVKPPHGVAEGPERNDETGTGRNGA